MYVCKECSHYSTDPMPSCEVPHCALDYEHVVPYEPQCERFNKRFSTYVIAYNPDTASFVVTGRRIFCWQHRAEFDTVKEGIEYFEKHVNRFIDAADAFRNKAAEKDTAGRYGLPVFLENTKKTYGMDTKQMRTGDLFWEYNSGAGYRRRAHLEGHVRYFWKGYGTRAFFTAGELLSAYPDAVIDREAQEC